MKFTCAPIAAAAFSLACSTAQAVDFNITFFGSTATNAVAQDAFRTAAQRWSDVFRDPVTINLLVGTDSLSTGILAQTASNHLSYSYRSFYSALSADKTSVTDAQAVGSLGSGSNFGVLINRTSNNPNGAASPTPYVDATGANTSNMRLTTANAKALGLSTVTGATDAQIWFNTKYSFDYNPTDGVGANVSDFVGVATHEIGHALGFESGTDVLDSNAGIFSDDTFTFVTALDLFRYSALSTASKVIDFTADTRDKYFSLDRGATVGPAFSTGTHFGDGSQSGHWKGDLGLGVMDPTADPGEVLAISANDVRAFDAIGWNVTPVPEPATYALFGLGIACLAVRRRAVLRG